MKKLLLLLLFLKIVYSVSINEIMYNPTGDDYDFEYIELKGSRNISGWYFSGIDYEFGKNVSINGFLIIANTCFEEGKDNDFIDKYNISCKHSYKGTLKNSGEEIILYDSKGLEVDKVNYDNKRKEGYSVGLINGEWKTNIASPMKENIEYIEEIIEMVEKEIIEEEIQEQTEIQIKYIKPDEAEWGDVIKMGLKIRNNQNSKYAVYGYIEDDASEKVTIHIKDKGEFELMLPIQIKSNCDDKFEDGKYDVVIKGLNNKDKKRIEIDGKKKKICKESFIEKERIVEKEIVVEKKIIEERIIVEREGVILESNDLAIKKIIPYFMAILFSFALIFSIVAFYNPINI